MNEIEIRRIRERLDAAKGIRPGTGRGQLSFLAKATTGAMPGYFFNATPLAVFGKELPGQRIFGNEMEGYVTPVCMADVVKPGNTVLVDWSEGRHTTRWISGYRLGSVQTTCADKKIPETLTLNLTLFQSPAIDITLTYWDIAVSGPAWYGSARIHIFSSGTISFSNDCPPTGSHLSGTNVAYFRLACYPDGGGWGLGIGGAVCLDGVPIPNIDPTPVKTDFTTNFLAASLSANYIYLSGIIWPCSPVSGAFPDVPLAVVASNFPGSPTAGTIAA